MGSSEVRDAGVCRDTGTGQWDDSGGSREKCPTVDEVVGEVVGIIHAATVFTTLTGQEGRGRYTDDWQRRNGEWACVSAHVTRLCA